MTRECDDDGDQQRETEHAEGSESMLIPATGEAVPAATDEPPPAPLGKTIHRRRPLPPVKDRD
jgi:hypothetical protein